MKPIEVDEPPVIVLSALEAEFDRRGIGDGPLTAERIGDGHSNFTFGVHRGAATWVLRRPPRPPYPPSAHDVLREHRVLAACADAPVRTPRPLFACDDTAVIGAPFYVMEYLAGHVLTTSVPSQLDSLADRRRIGEEVIDALVELHAMDWNTGSLASLGRPTGYLDRQLRRFGSLWELNATRAVPAVSEAGRLLAERKPKSGPPALVHGDFRLGNMLFAPESPARLVAMLDWEMATIGDPLADVGYLVATWAQPGDTEGALLELGTVTAEPGFMTRAELVERYGERSGREVGTLGWYEALASWKSAVFLEGSYKRFLSGNADDPYFARLEQGVPQLGERALAALEGM
jgi:aminoglycoside phosphotransferase (APT) family kinase protein